MDPPAWMGHGRESTVNQARPLGKGKAVALAMDREALLRAARDNAEALLAQLNSSADGLSPLQSRLRLERYGPNAIAHEQPPPWPLQLLRTFRNPLVLLLASLAALSLLTGDTKAALIIIDECSMVDEDLGKDLLSFGKPTLVLGDPAQLPPVKGGGYFTEAEIGRAHV